MKYVKEHINEKFSNESDPIHDLGIGGIDLVKKFDELFKPVIKEYNNYLLQCKGRRLRGKFRIDNNFNSKKYNIITGKIINISFWGSGWLKEYENIMFMFKDEEDGIFHYWLKDGEKFYIE